MTEQSHTGADTPAAGFVSFVGSGPGDPELLTLKAVARLQAADAVLFDDLSSGAVLGHARAGADLIAVGRTSMTIEVEAWRRARHSNDSCKVTQARFIFVAVGDDRKPRPVPPETN